jgi:glycerol-3-phosphate acyltransferase PlsY
VFLVQLWTGESALGGWSVPLAGLAVFLGHLYPVFHRFQGGKGVATAAGVLLGFSPWLGLGTLVTWAMMLAFFRLSSLAALVAALFAPCYALWAFGLQPLLPVTAAMSALLVWRHRENIRRLVAGEESRVGSKASPPPQDPSAGAP